jgi:MFS family permease
LQGNTTSLLASGVVGIVMFLATIPAVLYLDKWGRKPVLIIGAIWMGICHFVVAGIIGQFNAKWQMDIVPSDAKSAGWAAVVFIWLFAIGFGFSWGPT